jgi:hypothetical protein
VEQDRRLAVELPLVEEGIALGVRQLVERAPERLALLERHHPAHHQVSSERPRHAELLERAREHLGRGDEPDHPIGVGAGLGLDDLFERLGELLGSPRAGPGLDAPGHEPDAELRLEHAVRPLELRLDVRPPPDEVRPVVVVRVDAHGEIADGSGRRRGRRQGRRLELLGVVALDVALRAERTASLRRDSGQEDRADRDAPGGAGDVHETSVPRWIWLGAPPGYFTKLS